MPETPNDTPATAAGWLTIELLAENGADLNVMFEPTGMTYELSSGKSMSAKVLTHNQADRDVLRIVSTPGVVSIWAPGHVQTLGADGSKLHWLN